jgi:hypothetical protein
MNGDRIDSGHTPGGGSYATYRLLDGAEGDVMGPWVDTRGMRQMSVDVLGLAAGAVVLRGSNQQKPVADEAGHQLGDAITSDGLVLINGSVAWVRAAVERHRLGTITALLHVVA